jgi:hypothetical protein
MNFDGDFLKRSQDNLYPLLGRYDRIIEYSVQQASYPNCSINTVEKGHVTAATDGELLFNHLKISLKRLRPLKKASEGNNLRVLK